MRRGFFTGLILLGLLALFIFAFKKTPNQKLLLGNTNTTSHIDVEDVEFKDSSASINYEIDVKYPHISGNNKTKAENSLNSNIESIIKKGIEEFRKEVDQAEQNPNLPAQMRNNVINQYTVTYTTEEVNEKIASFHFTIFKNLVGMAHPETTNLTYTYDMKNNKVISLADLFKQNSNYLQKLSSITQQRLTSELKNIPSISSFVKDGAAPDNKNFQHFTVSSDSITLYFDPSMVAPDFAGTQKVTISLKDLSDILNTTYF